MHELAITESVVEAVRDHVDGRSVVAVHLRVGKLSGVVPDAMRFCFDLATAGTSLEGARLEIDEPSGAAHCRECGRDFAIDDLILLCACGSADVEVTAGRDLTVASVEVA